MSDSMAKSRAPITLDCMHYCDWLRRVVEEMRACAVDATHAAVSYDENMREKIDCIAEWNRRVALNADLTLPGREAEDIERGRASNRTAVFFGGQNPSPIESDLRLIEMPHTSAAGLARGDIDGIMGENWVRFMSATFAPAVG